MMKFWMKSLIVLAVIAVVVLLANAGVIATWLDRSGVVDLARWIRREYLTGTAITVIVVMLFLLAGPTGPLSRLVHRCRVCGRLLLTPSKYCGKCGSRL